MKYLIIAINFIVVLALQGCGNLNSIHRPLPLGEGALIDIKQRAIIAGKSANQLPVICTEPSPDATAAYAFEAAGKLDKAPAQFSLASQEAAAYTGLRTSSIQLLRDQLFHNCLNYMNGAIDKDEFDLLARRFQKQAIAMLAIEQLTGAVRAPTIVLTSSGNAQNSGLDVSASNKQLGEIEDQIAKNNIAIASEKDEAAKKLLEEKNKLLTERRASILKSSAANAGLSVSGETKAQIDKQAEKDNAQLSSVAAAVAEITRIYVEADDASQLCLSRLAKDPEAKSVYANLCKDVLLQLIEQRKIENEAARANIKIAEEKGTPIVVKKLPYNVYSVPFKFNQ